MSKYLFLISHPAHLHMFKHAMAVLQEKGHKIVIVIRPKDVLEQLCTEYGLSYIRVNERQESKGKLNMALSLLKKIWDVNKIVKKEKPALLIGSDGVLAYIGKLQGIPSFEFFEDDVSVINLYAKLFFPFYSKLVSPSVTDAGKWKYKQVTYKGYQKLAYLHPNYFTPDIKIIKKYNLDPHNYFILRFSNLMAHHDLGIGGFNDESVREVIEILKPHGSIYITSEKSLTPEFEPYRLRINPSDMHHILSFSKLLIGDSQSMSVEAAILGIPSVRFSDFAGKISVLEELEHKYGLTFGITTDKPNQMLKKIKELLEIADLKNEFEIRKNKMLSEKTDVTRFFISFIENYPNI